ncbi:MAG: AI-2E family transporter [Candidatus Izemoplasmataceae bacterium]|jgi:predicted PurR-regulated permease PerM
MKKESRLLSDQMLNRALKILGILILATLLIYMMTLFTPFWRSVGLALRAVLIPVGLAWLISLIIFPIVRLIEKRGIGPRALSVAIVYVFTAVVLYGLLSFLIPFVMDQVKQFFATDYPLLADYFRTQFREDFIFGTEMYDFFARAIQSSDAINNAVETFFASLTTVIPSTLLGLITVIAILPILLLFYLLDYERVNDTLKGIIPKKYARTAGDLATRLNHTVGAYIRGQLFLMFAIGTVATITYKLIGLEYYFIFGIIVGLTNVIPYFGALIAMIPAVTYAFITRDFGPNPFLVVGVNIMIQFIEGNIFQPIIMGKQLEIHPIIIIISILFFGSLFGALGVIFASPIAATLRVLYEFFKERREMSKEQVSLVGPEKGS